MKRIAKFVSLLTISLIVCSISAASAKDNTVNLKLQLKPGQTFELKTNNDTVYTFKVMGRNKTEIDDIKLDYTCSVESIDDKGNATLNATYKSIAYKLNTEENQFDFDSSNGTSLSSPSAKALNGLLGKSFKIVLSPTGEISDLPGLTEIRSQAKKTLSDLYGTEKRDAEDIVTSVAGNLYVTEILENAFRLYPKKPIKADERWSIDPIATMDIPCLKQSFYKISSKGSGLTYLKTFRNYTFNQNESNFTSSEKSGKFVVSGSVSGMTSIDDTSRLIKSYKGSGQLSGKFSIINANYSTELPVTIDITESVERS